ncbi:MAG: two-component regulator propeller domain-containing protein [Anaerolineales bacterium]
MRFRNILWIIFLSLLATSCQATPSTPPQSVVDQSPASLTLPQPGTIPNSSYYAQTPYSQNIRFEQFSLEEGLSQSVVNVVLQDRMGFLWVGTEDGLNRYDGYSFKVFKPNEDDPNSLSDRWITSMVEDNEGYLWVGTRVGGISRYNPVTGKFTRYLHDESNPLSIISNKISSLLMDINGIWIGTENGLDFYDYETKIFTHFRTSAENPNSLRSNSITTLFKDKDGVIWIGTANSGLNQYNPKEKTFQSFRYNEEDASSLSDNRVLSIEESISGEIWVGTANGLNRFEVAGKYFTRFVNSKNDPNSINGNRIFVIYTDRAGGLWIGTNNGLDRYDPLSKKFIHHRHQPTVGNSLSNNVVYEIYEDLNGILWVGTYGGGLNKYNRQQDKFSYYHQNTDDPFTLSDDLVFPIVEDNQGFIWVGTGNGLNRFNPSTEEFVQFTHDPINSNSLSSNDITALLSDRNGILWIGGSHGLDRLNSDGKSFSHYPIESINANSLTIFSIYEDRQNNLLVGTNRGLFTFDPIDKSFSPFGISEATSTPLDGIGINYVLEDREHNLWIGTADDGLKLINAGRNKITQYKNDPNDPYSLSNDSVMVVYQDTSGTIWVGTTGGGLNRYNQNNDTFSRFTEKNGLPNNVIYGILEDEAGNLWLSTNFGISRFNIEDQTFRNFTAGDGLQSNEFNQNAFLRARDGHLYFGGINGFNSFLPKDIESNPYPPRVLLTSLTQDGRPINQEQNAEYLQTITLKYPNNSFEFEFTALAYGQPSKNHYAYKLEGFDTNWNEINNKRNGRYTNLPGGTYTLLLKGSNSDGTWNNNGQKLIISIIPPFWVTWWFRSVLLFGLAISIAGVLRWRVKSIEGRNRELERVVQKRTGDLEKRTREMEALYQADEKILRNVTLNQVFQTLVDVSVTMLKADRSVVFTWSNEQNKIIPRVSHGFRAETLFALRFDEGEGLVGQAMKTGESVLVPDLKLRDLRGDVQTVIHAEGIQSFAHFPISVDGKVVAVFNVGYTRPNAINEDNIRLFTALVQRASLSIANMQLFEQTKDLAVMEERNRLARDLHDSAKQKAFAALAQLGTANGLWKVKADGIQPHLSEAENLIYEVIQELTFLVQEIYPIGLQEKGLPTTLREYIFEWENRNDISVNVVIRNERALPLEAEQAVYRVIQEALANVSRHSKAKQVDISLVYNHDSLQVNISDNGVGFDINQKAKGMGFRSMRERISSVRGNLQVKSVPGQGTHMIIQLPIKMSAGVEKL